MKKIILLIFIVLSITGFTQNLIPNPSFELYSICPDDWSQISYCQNWSSYGGTPDYFNECTPYIPSTYYFSCPNNYMGFQYPHSGNGYAGFYQFFDQFPDSREFIGSQLISPLLVSQKYYIAFYINLGGQNQAMIGSNNMGVKFTTLPFSELHPPPVNNSVHMYSNVIVTDTVKWTKISGSFIADSAYNYIMIGNFFTDSNTDTINLIPNPVCSYYFIDDICVSTDSLYCENWLGIKQNESKSEELTIYPNPAKDHISISSSNEDISNICITDITGKEVYKTTSKENIDISFLCPGTYFVTISTLTNNYTKKLVVVR